jgi:hypothetical protein
MLPQDATSRTRRRAAEMLSRAVLRLLQEARSTQRVGAAQRVGGVIPSHALWAAENEMHAALEAAGDDAELSSAALDALEGALRDPGGVVRSAAATAVNLASHTSERAASQVGERRAAGRRADRGARFQTRAPSKAWRDHAAAS